MASSSTTSPDTQITLKINHDGVHKKMKLPIRDLGASSLEEKLGAALFIIPGTKTVFERYSDSAGSYVTLDPSNVSVYKQLYRAAKAKQKLKLRVTTIDEETEVEDEPKNIPKPVTVEDVPESLETAQVENLNVNRSEETLVDVPAPPPAPAVAPVSQPACSRAASYLFQFPPQTQLHSQLSHMAKNNEELEKNLAQLEASVALLNKTCPRWDNIGQPIAEADEPEPVVEDPAKDEIAPPAPRATFAVCCNSCDHTVPDSHYHCSTCDEGDFDLCQNCVDMGITCYGNDHWLIKRFVKNGMIINSTTERIAPKPKAKTPEPAPAPPTETVPAARVVPIFTRPFRETLDRTCNNCVAEMPESEFVHCTTCYDFDLCKACFAKNDHGHHPKHGFIPATEGIPLDYHVRERLAPGRNVRHNAICDGCDKYIRGIRHKCLDCPDWDYCSECIDNAGFVHPDHRFVPIYEPIKEVGRRSERRSNHVGICCDGPLCNTAGKSEYIVGDRYKCAVCHDLDFCANCEASPANIHNKTHPLIKFKTAVRHVSVTTTGEHENGKRMPSMGDRPRGGSFQNRATETTSTEHGLAFNKVQTNVDVEPVEAAAPVKVEEPIVKEEEKLEEVAPQPPTPVQETPVEKLVAVYESDTVADGTVLPPNHVFEQTWVLRNEGSVAWPAGCSVKFVSGDYMGHVDPTHPAGISELVSASETTICYNKLEPGEEFPFTVLLRTPSRSGKAISYWRLTTKDGFKFGHRLWCDVNVQAPKPKEEPKPEVKEEAAPVKLEESEVIFPKLEKESPVASIHEDIKSETVPAKSEEEFDDFEDSADEWAEDDGFMTDEEYDILDASDEEYLEDQQKKLLKK